MLSRFALTALSVSALLAGAPLSVYAEDDPPALAECRRLTAVFDLLALPSVAGKKFVSFNTSKYLLRDGKVSFEFEPGWLISDTEKEITLFQENLEVATFQKSAQLPPEWETLKKDHPAGCPLPRESMEFDFEEFCDDVLKEGIPDQGDEHTRTMARIGHRTWGGFSHAIELVLKARWSLERGQSERAIKLVALARRSFEAKFETRTRGERDREATFERELEVSIAENARWRAIRAADRGTSRADLLAAWKLVGERLPEGPWRAEAKQLTGLYEQQIVEDGVFAKVPRAELVKRDEEKQCAYWVHELRDLDFRGLGPIGWPGAKPADDNPAAQLVKLGWPAVPALIARLEDESPTRCMAYYRQHALNSYYLLRLADVCASLLYMITAHDFPEHRQIYGADHRVRVAKDWKHWWDETGSKGAEVHFLSLIDSGPHTFQRTVAAEGLLRIDATRFLPLLCKKIAALADPGDRSWLLRALEPHLTKEHAPLLARFLDDESAEVVLAAAHALRVGCKSEKGAERVLAIATSWKTKEDADAKKANGFQLVAFLLETRPITKPYVDGVIALMESPVADAKAAALRESWRMPDERIARALLTRLDRKEKIELWGREGDLAACGLKRMLGIPGAVDFRDGPETERERAKVALRTSMEGAAKIDWAALVRQADEDVKRDR